MYFDDAVAFTRDIFPLPGKSYYAVSSAVLYHLGGHFLRYIQIKGVGDMRVPLLVFMPSGSGKQLIIDLLKMVITKVEGYEHGVIPESQAFKNVNGTDGYIPDSFRMPSSIHPEQLVGKTIRLQKRGNIVYEKIYGYLASNYVCLDEGYELLTSDSHVDTRRYIIKAMDPIGSNVIEKTMVDVHSTESIRFTPICSISLFSQPMEVLYDVVHRGFFRRFLTVYMRIPFEEHLSNTKYYVKVEPSSSSMRRFYDEAFYLKCLASDMRVKVEITEESKHVIMELLREMLYPLKDTFKEIMLMSVRNFLVKSALIYSAVSKGADANGVLKIGMDDVCCVYDTVLDIYETAFAFVRNYVNIDSLDVIKYIKYRLKTRRVLEPDGYLRYLVYLFTGKNTEEEVMKFVRDAKII